ncbi:MAG: DUF5663 domain-containing protein [Patescibacteria group bacterium]
MNPIQKNITDVFDFSHLPPEEQEKKILDIGSIIYQNVLMRVMETIPEEVQDEFEKILDNNAQPEEIFNFLNSKVDNFEKIIEEEALKFKDHTNDIMGQIGN